MKGYPVANPTFEVPHGYSLREDEDFVYLHFCEEEIATFHMSVLPNVIQDTIEVHQVLEEERQFKKRIQSLSPQQAMIALNAVKQGKSLKQALDLAEIW